MSSTQHLTRTMAAHSWRGPVLWTMVAAGLALGQASAAGAASFSVNPTQVFLSATTKSALVTLKNESDQPVRFQLTLMSWSQAPDGQMQLAATEDIIFFPALLTLNAREERKVRVGATVPPGAVEKTYRLFVEELPPLEKKEMPNSVTMLTKMGVPIFLQPARITAQAALRDLAVAGGRLSFRLLNTGTVHFAPEAVWVRGLDEAGATLFDQKADVWYVLAGGLRAFDVEVPVARCALVRSLVVEARLPGTMLKETLQAPGGACQK